MGDGAAPILSIVVLTCNEKTETLRCLGSLFDHIDERSEVIVVDNGSTDGTLDAINASFVRVRTYFLPTNVGVAAGRNYGIDRSLGQYIMTIDNDTVYHGPEPVDEILRLFSTLPNVGVTGFRLLNEDGSLQRNFRRFPTLLQPFVARIGILSRSRTLRAVLDSHLMNDVATDRLNEALEVDYVIGANQIFRRDLFLRLGKYDETIFYGPEDCELCLRFKMNGYKNYYCPDIRISHLYKRRSRNSAGLLLTHFKGFVAMFWKHKRLFSLYP